MEPEDDEQRKIKSDLVAQVLSLMGELNKKLEDSERGGAAHLPPGLAQLQNRLAAQSFDLNIHQAAQSSLTAIQPPLPFSSASPSSMMIPLT